MVPRCLKYAVLLLAILWAGHTHAQAIQQVIATAGGTGTTPNGYTIDFTVGETVIATAGTDPSCTEGFHQPIAGKHPADSNLTAAGWYLKVYPNPVHDQLTIHAYMDKAAAIDCRVVDMLGRELLIRRLAFQLGYNDAMLQLSTLGHGVYVLYISDPVHGVRRSIKLLKD